MRKKREGEVERERKMSKREKNSKKWSILFVAMYLYHDDPVSARPSYTHAPSASSPFIAHHKALMVWLWLNHVRLISIRQLWSPRHSVTFRGPSFSLRPLLFFFLDCIFFYKSGPWGLGPWFLLFIPLSGLLSAPLTILIIFTHDIYLIYLI
jgi:hypothetical protein